MMIKKISVPNLNDSFSRIVLDNVQYLLRFTWNEAAKRWSFGLYTLQREPIVVGIRLVPNFPLNLQVVDDGFPPGVFGVFCNFESIGRNCFAEDRATFAYIPKEGGA